MKYGYYGSGGSTATYGPSGVYDSGDMSFPFPIISSGPTLSYSRYFGRGSRPGAFVGVGRTGGGFPGGGGGGYGNGRRRRYFGRRFKVPAPKRKRKTFRRGAYKPSYTGRKRGARRRFTRRGKFSYKVKKAIADLEPFRTQVNQGSAVINYGGNTANSAKINTQASAVFQVGSYEAVNVVSANNQWGTSGCGDLYNMLFNLLGVTLSGSSGTPANAIGLQQVPVEVERNKLFLNFKNNHNFDCHCAFYWLAPKLDIQADTGGAWGIDPNQDWLNILDTQGQASGVVNGSIPTGTKGVGFIDLRFLPGFTRIWRILASTKRKICPGGDYSTTLTQPGLRKGKFMNPTLKLGNSGTNKQDTRFLLVLVHGPIVHSSAAIGSVTYGSGVLDYTWKHVTKGRLGPQPTTFSDVVNYINSSSFPAITTANATADPQNLNNPVTFT